SPAVHRDRGRGTARVDVHFSTSTDRVIADGLDVALFDRMDMEMRSRSKIDVSEPDICGFREDARSLRCGRNRQIEDVPHRGYPIRMEHSYAIISCVSNLHHDVRRRALVASDHQITGCSEAGYVLEQR